MIIMNIFFMIILTDIMILNLFLGFLLFRLL